MDFRIFGCNIIDCTHTVFQAYTPAVSRVSGPLSTLPPTGTKTIAHLAQTTGRAAPSSPLEPNFKSISIT